MIPKLRLTFLVLTPLLFIAPRPASAGSDPAKTAKVLTEQQKALAESLAKKKAAKKAEEPSEEPDDRDAGHPDYVLEGGDPFPAAYEQVYKNNEPEKTSSDNQGSAFWDAVNNTVGKVKNIFGHDINAETGTPANKPVQPTKPAQQVAAKPENCNVQLGLTRIEDEVEANEATKKNMAALLNCVYHGDPDLRVVVESYLQSVPGNMDRYKKLNNDVWQDFPSPGEDTSDAALKWAGEKLAKGDTTVKLSPKLTPRALKLYCDSRGASAAPAAKPESSAADDAAECYVQSGNGEPVMDGGDPSKRVGHGDTQACLAARKAGKKALKVATDGSDVLASDSSKSDASSDPAAIACANAKRSAALVTADAKNATPTLAANVPSPGSPAPDKDSKESFLRKNGAVIGVGAGMAAGAVLAVAMGAGPVGLLVAILGGGLGGYLVGSSLSGGAEPPAKIEERP